MLALRDFHNASAKDARLDDGRPGNERCANVSHGVGHFAHRAMKRLQARCRQWPFSATPGPAEDAFLF
jgi:hypothetical protein